VIDFSEIYFVDSDELLPQEGNDEDYDKIVAEIADLEKQLDLKLKVWEGKLKLVFFSCFINPR
jgi:hypothetical protein